MNEVAWIEESLYTEIQARMPIPCVDLLIVHEGNLLLMLRNNEPGKGLWFTPGGRILKGETLEKAVYRILQKETGLEPVKLEQKGVMSHLWPDIHTVTVLHLVHVSCTDVQMNDEHRDYKWISHPSNDLHEYLKEMIQLGRPFSESGLTQYEDASKE